MDTTGEEGSNNSAAGEQAIKADPVGGIFAGAIVEHDASSRTVNYDSKDTEENRSENDLEHHQASVRTSPRMASSKRKTKNSDNEASAMSTRSPPKTQKKARHDIDDSAPAQSKSRKKTSFDERCNQLLQYKEQFGDCNVPQRYAENKSLGVWCRHMRAAYRSIQKGVAPACSLPQDRMDKLEELGFEWNVINFDEVFEKRCFELEAFKEEFGHCTVPYRYTANPSLGIWCGNMRSTYFRNQKGAKTTISLSQNRIEQLEKIGFQWRVFSIDEVFEKRILELITFKEEFGHCNVPQRYQGNPSLGKWCAHIREAYKRIQKGLKPLHNYLPQDRIERLEEMGFKWYVR